MPKTHITRTKIINAPVEAVYEAVANLAKWEAWSPWLIMEPEAKVTVADDGQSYGWVGQRVGKGHMAITSEITNLSVRYDLTFLKPFKSQAKVGMDVKAVGNATEVTWSMNTSMPFFMVFMKAMMETFIGMDYERGLNLLKDYAEDGEVHSKLNFIGVHDYAGCDYVGIKRACSLDNMPVHMKTDFERLGPWAAKNGLNPAKMFSIYHKFNPIKGICQYTAAVPTDGKSVACPNGFICGIHAPTKIYILEHVGPYHHLGTAWSTMHSLIRNKEIKPIKKYHPFETYGNSPVDTAPNNLITRVNFAVS